MELYVQYKDYNWMMEFTERMLEFICLEVLGTTKVRVGDREIDFKAPYRRVTMLDAIKEHTGYDLTGKTEEQIREIAQKLKIEVDDTMGKGKLIDEIFGEKCEGSYIQPTFITDYPIEMSPLCKRHRSNPELTERFELMVNGKELANAYSELNDPIDQEARFQQQIDGRGDDEVVAGVVVGGVGVRCCAVVCGGAVGRRELLGALRGRALLGCVGGERGGGCLGRVGREDGGVGREGFLRVQCAVLGERGRCFLLGGCADLVEGAKRLLERRGGQLG